MSQQISPRPHTYEFLPKSYQLNYRTKKLDHKKDDHSVLAISQLRFRVFELHKYRTSDVPRHQCIARTKPLITNAFYQIATWKDTIPKSICGTLLFLTRVCSCLTELDRSSVCTHMYRSTKEPLWANFGSWRSQTVEEPQEMKPIRWINDELSIERIEQRLRRLKFKPYHRCLQNLFLFTTPGKLTTFSPMCLIPVTRST